MDDFDVRDIPPPPKPDEEPIPFDDSNHDSEQSGVSHAPLNLGSEPAQTQEPIPTVQSIEPVVQKEEKILPGERITGVRTFFTKLHAGAIEFLDNQITEWLQKNPGIVIKRTNIATGEVQAKKSEPNIIITIWY